jgi:hypothetical protein
MAVAYVLLNFPIYEGRLDVVPPAATFARPSVTQSLGESKPKNNWKGNCYLRFCGLEHTTLQNVQIRYTSQSIYDATSADAGQ